jgi:polysaccharide biosynthesis protein PelA
MRVLTTMTIIIVLGLAVLFIGTWLMRSQTPLRWAVYYGEALPYSAFNAYDLVVFDADKHPSFAGQRRRGQVLLGYLSLAEVEKTRTYYDRVQELGVLRKASATWPNARLIDIREPVWRDFVVQVLVPHVLEQGFDGVMIDTVDSALHLEEENPVAYAGMQDAAVQLVQDIRAAYPDMRIMLNRGFAILPQVAGSLDYVLAESIRVRYDMAGNHAELFPDAVYNALVQQLKQAQDVNPRLKVMTLDYWKISPQENDVIRDIYAQQRSHGFAPYVTTIDLLDLHGEP